MQLRAYGPQNLEDRARNHYCEGMAMRFRFDILPILAGGSLGLNDQMVLVMAAETFAQARVDTRGSRLDKVH